MILPRGKRAARRAVPGLLAGLALAACASSNGEEQEALYSGEAVDQDARIAALESRLTEMKRAAGERGETLAEMDSALAELRQRLEGEGSAGAAAARDHLAEEAKAARDKLAQRIDSLAERVAALEERTQAMASRIDAASEAASRAMAEARRVRNLLNRRAAERGGSSVAADEQAAAAEASSSSANEANAGAAGDNAAAGSDGSAGGDGSPKTAETGSASGAGGTSGADGASGGAGDPGGAPQYAVHLASYRSAESARTGWAELRERYSDLLGERRARLKPLDLGELGGRYLRLLAGPFPDVAPANEICEKLRAEDNFCQVAAFSGEPLQSSGG